MTYLRPVTEGEKFKIYALAKSREKCELFSFFKEHGSNMNKQAVGLIQFLDNVAKNGMPMDTEKIRHLRDGIREFRQGRTRLLWFYDEGKMIIITHGILKKSQKTPKKEIDYSVEMRKFYLHEKENENVQILPE